MSNLTENNIWKVFESYYESNGVVISQIESYNDFVTFGLQEIIDQESTITTPNYIVKFGQISLAEPHIIEEDRTLNKIYPGDARKRDLNYDTAVYCDISETFIEGDKKEEKIHRRIVIGRLPVMLKSCICNLSRINKQEQVEKGECPNDPGGYFIIKGNERALVAQMRGNYNQVFVLKQKPGEKYKYIAETRSMSNETGHSVLIQAMISVDDRGLFFSLPYIKEPIQVGIVFKALGYTREEDIVNFIGLENEKCRKYIRYIVRDSFICETKEDALSYIGERSLHINTKDREQPYATQIVNTELFPHLGISATPKEYACFLGHILRKLLATNLGLRGEDDRDNYSNKRVEVAGTLLYDIFRNLFKKYIQFIKTQLDKKKQRPDIISIISRTKNITKGLHQCMATGNWGVQKNASYMRTGVSQVLDRMTYCATLSHLRRVLIPVGKEGKNTAIRQIHSSQYGFICPCETPEGGKVGIVLNFALLAKTSKKNSTVNTRRIIEECKTVTLTSKMNVEQIKNYSTVFLNNIIIGFTQDPDSTVEEIKKLRTIGLLDKEVSVTYDIVDNDVKVFCDEGRFIRPLFTLTDNKLNIQPQEKYKWRMLIKKGLIQYVDASEIENSVIAMTPKMLEEQYNNYCEIHPCAMLGIAAAMIPFSDHSQSPRNCYQSSMSKQALGMPLLSYNVRSDTILHVLHYPQKPLVHTKAAEIFGFNNMPSGINAIVAIACYSGFNQEDSVMLNFSAVQRGMFCLTSYHTIDCIEKKRDTYSFEEICLPPLNSDSNIKEGDSKYFKRKNANYGFLDENGIVMTRTSKGQPITVKKGDVIIGKVVITGNKNGEQTKVDASVVIDSGEEGVIDRVITTITPNGYKLVKVIIRVYRSPTMGDKLACYDPETEVLTSRGWISVKDVTLEHKVACLVDDKKLEYHNPTEVQNYDYQGKMYRVESDKIDLLVTPNHRMYVGNCHRQNFNMKRADEIYGKMSSYKINADIWQPEDCLKTFTLPGVEDLPDLILPLKEWCIFFGIWITEGSCSVSYLPTGGISSRHVNIEANKSRVRDELKIIEDSLFLKTHKHMSKGELVNWTCHDPRLISYLRPLSVGVINKYLPKWCFKLDMEHSRYLIHGMVLGDGCYMKDTTTIRYGTSSIRLRDDFNRLCIHSGWGCNYYLKTPKGTKSKCLGREIVTNADHWTLTICKSQIKPLVNKYIKSGKQLDSWIDYNGKVYCCTVPTEK